MLGSEAHLAAGVTQPWCSGGQKEAGDTCGELMGKVTLQLTEGIHREQTV